jgi:hypothetical protein
MRADKLRTHAHYRPYFVLRDKTERYGQWHHSKRKAWDEVARIINNLAIEWTEFVTDYGVGVEMKPNSARQCEVSS